MLRIPSTNHPPHRLDHQAGAVLDRSAVGIGSLVAAVLQELVLQIAVRAVQLDTIKAGNPGVAGCNRKAFHDRRDLFDVQFARHRKIDPTARQEEVAARRNRRRTDRCVAATHVWMSDAAAVPDLAENMAAGRVDRICDLAPLGDLVLAVDTGTSDDSMALIGYLGAFGDDQAGGGALHVIVPHQIGRHTILAGACSRHRGHRDPVGERERSEIERAEQVGHDLTSSVERKTGRAANSAAQVNSAMTIWTIAAGVLGADSAGRNGSPIQNGA